MGAFTPEEIKNFNFKGWLGILGSGDRDQAPDNLAWYEELTTLDTIIKPEQIWDDYRSLPPAVTRAEALTNTTNNPTILKEYTSTGKAIHCTPSPNEKHYFATSVYGNIQTTLKNWIMPQLVPRSDSPYLGFPSIGYMVRLYNGNPDTGGTEITTTIEQEGGVTAWFMNFGAGVIKVSSSFTGVTNPNDVWLRGFRYVGRTLADSKLIYPFVIADWVDANPWYYLEITHNYNDKYVDHTIYKNDMEVRVDHITLVDKNTSRLWVPYSPDLRFDGVVMVQVK